MSSPIADRPLRILQVGTIDEGGGAAAVATGLMRAYRARGCRVWQVVGRKRSHDGGVIVLPDDLRAVYRLTGYSRVQARLRLLAGRHPNTGWGLISRVLRSMTHPSVAVSWWKGREDFDFPGTYKLLDLLDTLPDVAHCHNLHGEFFDLRALPWLSHQVPTALTLHDMWFLTGHCAYSLACDRWKIGCGACPDLNLYPAVRQDATAENWQRKRDLYAASLLYVAAPSRWLLDQARQSILAPAIRHGRVIPNGVDLSIFQPADRVAVRTALDIPPQAKVVLLTTGSVGSMWKDDRVSRDAMNQIAEAGLVPDALFIAIGRDTALPSSPRAQVRSVPQLTDARQMAQYYQAADVYVHATRADNCPLTVLEALACGTPVVATDIGGVGEQIHSIDGRGLQAGADPEASGATGILVPPGDADAMAAGIVSLLSNETARQAVGRNAARDARARFGMDAQVEVYLDWYRTIIEDWRGRTSP